MPRGTSVVRSLLVSLLFCWPAAAVAQAPADWLLPAEREVALALSAAPPAVAAGAGVYRLEAGGYRLHRASRNGFTCLVERSHPRSLEPICYDREATAAILPRVFDEMAARLAGTDAAAIRRATAEGYRSGRYRPPQRMAVAYMLAPEQRSHDPATGRTTPIPRHLMFYTPFVTDADLGLAPGAEATGARFFVVDPGTPTAFVTVLMDAVDDAVGGEATR
ncbi:MAG TPA: hypothetical protein VFS40_05695 [Gemmatimonadales bacterium]|nr:hypothetical protein [Gemmatimonadales bacterium]